MRLRKGIEEGLQGFAVTYTVVMVVLHCLALFFYATHIPERWWPHTFDIWVSGLSYSLTIPSGRLTPAFGDLQGASHQIFHVLVDIGQVAFLLGLRKVMLRQSLRVNGPSDFQSPSDTSLSM